MTHIYSTFEQFSIIRILPIHPFGNFDISYTNSALFITIAVIFIIALHSVQAKIIPGRWQSVLEITYEQVSGLVRENLGAEGARYFPFILTLFLLLATMNLVGIVPYTFTPTAHVVVAMGMSISIWLACTLIGLLNHRLEWWSQFFPVGTPLLLAPLIVPIELISYSIRAITLGVRLAANITAGHLLLAILSGFAWQMLLSGGLIAVLGTLPFAIVVAITGLEIGVALIQAFVFTLLTTIYINDSLHLH